MAYNTPPEKNVGNLISASDWNLAVTDNFQASVPDIFTTKGDLAVASGAQAMSRFAKGVDNTFLLSDSDVVTYGARWMQMNTAVYARYNFSGDFSVVAPYIILNFDGGVTDMGGAGNTVTTGTGWKFTAPTPGLYVVTVVCTKTAGSAATTDALHLRKSGNFYKIMQSIATNPAGGLIAGTSLIYLETDAYCTVRYYASANITLVAASGASHVAIARVY